MRTTLCATLMMIAALCAHAAEPTAEAILLHDDFSAYTAGLFAQLDGAHSEYHYLHGAAPRGNWAVSTFRSKIDTQRAWRIVREGGRSAMAQFATNKEAEFHPMIVAGDPLWSDYTATVRFTPDAAKGRCGVAFRYQNDRCYYFFGVEGGKAVLLRVNHAKAFHKPDEKVLAERKINRNSNEPLTATIAVMGGKIRASLNGGAALEAEDATFATGKVALLADVPARFWEVTVTTTAEVKSKIQSAIATRAREEQKLQAANPKPVLWKKFSTGDFGVGRNLRFGDLDGDGKLDILFGQVVHHGPKDSHSELSCLTAVNLDGETLWQIGKPDGWKTHLTNDVAFQIHDLDGDGKNEVVYTMGMEIIVADGATGKTKYKAPTPAQPPSAKTQTGKFPRVLGDCLYFCDLHGQGRAGDIIIKDRYENAWALDGKLNALWHVKCNTGHYPFAYDIDGDGKDELMLGYSLIDHDGKVLWSLDGQLQDHADGVAIVNFRAAKDDAPRLLCAASDEGLFTADLTGKILTHHYLGHVQNPSVADYRPDLPGLETVAVNYWGNQGIITFFDARGNPYFQFEPSQQGSLCLPTNWTGKAPEYFMLSANVEEGGLFDGWGCKVVTLPADGHPDLCYAVLDVTGDCRDELIVWDECELWIYTQSDNPLPGSLYRTRRNPLYNYSNYAATVSIPVDY